MIGRIVFSRAVLCVAPLCLAASGSADVLVVDAGGGAAFSDIPDAVLAAMSGDTILVKAGTYTGFTVAGKSLTVTADTGAVVQIQGDAVTPGGATVFNLSAVQSVVLRGLRFSSPGLDAGLLVLDCLGPVLAEDCVFRGSELIAFATTREGATVRNSDQVTFVRCQMVGGSPPFGTPTTFFGGNGLGVRDGSTAYLFECTLEGGDGTQFKPLMIGDGGAGLAIADASFAYSSGSSMQGGDGGPGDIFCLAFSDAGDGGPGIVLFGTPAVAQLLDTTSTGGMAGSAPNPMCAGSDGLDIENLTGTVNLIPGTARSMAFVHPIRDGEMPSFTFEGEPGDFVFLGVSLGQQPFFLANLEGPIFPTLMPLFTFFMGNIPPSGTLVQTLNVGSISGGSALVVFGQMVIATPTAPTDIRVGNGQSLIVLDPAF